MLRILTLVALLSFLRPCFSAENDLSVRVHRPDEIKVIDDFFLLRVEVENNSNQTILLGIPAPGALGSTGISLKFRAPSSWVSKNKPAAPSMGIVVGPTSKMEESAEILPKHKHVFELDIRDYFSEIDFKNNTVDFEVQIEMTGKAAPNEASRNHAGQWSGSVSFSRKRIVGTIIKI